MERERGVVGRWSREEAMAAGLIYRVVAVDELEESVYEMAHLIASKPPEAVKLARDLLIGDRRAVVERIHREAELFAERLRSDEARSAFMAFMNRKKG